LGANQIKELASDKKKAAIVRASCFSHFRNTGGIDPKKGITYFREEILSMWEGPLPPTMYKMTKAQLAKFQSDKVLKEHRCATGFDLSKLDVSLFKEVPQDCFANWLENVREPIDKKYLKAISVEHLKQAGEEAIANFGTLVGADPDNWKHVHADIVNYLLSNPEYASAVHWNAIKASTKVSAEVFAAMRPGAQVKVMEVASELPDDLFSQIYPYQVDEWKLDDSMTKAKKKACERLQCFNLVGDRKNAAALMAGLPDWHCMDRNFGELKLAWTFGEHLTKACYKQLNDVDDAALGEYSEVHEHVLQFVPYDTIKTTFVKGQWKGLAEDYIQDKGKKGHHVSVWRGILRNPKVCRSVVKEKWFKELREDKMTAALSGFSSQCLRALPFFGKLGAEDVKAFGPDAYTRFTKADKGLIHFDKSTHEQIARISASVADIADHYASQVTADDVKTMPDGLFAILDESWYRAFPEDTYAGISAEQLAAVPAERTVGIAAAKIKKLSSAAGGALTAEQVAVIGSATGAEKEVLEALAGFTLSEGAKAALKSRVEAAGNAAVSLAGAGLISLAAALALLTPFL
jgi:hypothetical protein